MPGPGRPGVERGGGDSVLQTGQRKGGQAEQLMGWLVPVHLCGRRIIARCDRRSLWPVCNARVP